MVESKDVLKSFLMNLMSEGFVNISGNLCVLHALGVRSTISPETVNARSIYLPCARHLRVLHTIFRLQTCFSPTWRNPNMWKLLVTRTAMYMQGVNIFPLWFLPCFPQFDTCYFCQHLPPFWGTHLVPKRSPINNNNEIDIAQYPEMRSPLKAHYNINP
jgi:hypothetical protein